jgi:hypothetical protein
MPPITLTKQQFGQTAAGKKTGAKYSGYLSYIARHRAAKLAQANADPLGQTSPGDINSQVNRYAGMYGNPMTDEQITTSAQGQIDPIIAAITKKINDQASTASGAISANSQALAKALGGIDYGAPYAQAKTEQAAVDAALQQSLGGAGGTGLAQDLESRLAQIGDPAVAAAGADVASRGAAIGGTQVAQGSSNLGSLIASAAAAKEYGAKQPGIAQLSGLQDIAGVNRQAVTDIGDQTAQITSQLPQIVAALRAEAQNTRSNRAQAAAQLYETLTGQNLTKATAKAGLAGDQATLDYQYANANADAAASAASTAERTRHDVATEATAAKRAAAAATKATKGKTFTPAQLQKFRGDALDIAETAKSGAAAVTDAKGNVKEAALPPISREQAILEMERHGIPKQIAVQTANRVYGKPLTPAQVKAQKKTNAALFTGPNALLPH